MATNHGIVRFTSGSAVVTPGEGNSPITAVKVIVYDNDRSPLEFKNDTYKVTAGEVKVFTNAKNTLLFTPTVKDPVSIQPM
ncbi:hypothetical protein [Shimazuella alba]|uniref:Uncharacterized protein n=1 Tax=Shimazuella alba TaxID=2690964 RepID=A0A6I4VZG0_9BACL|nr:hypothetical protein [Shimazuella alba]MXQ55938.1 hypothetical protein [Shimazuella alba]